MICPSEKVYCENVRKSYGKFLWSFGHFCFLLFFLFLTACSNYSPKPSGYFRIDLPAPVYSPVDTHGFRMDISDQARIVSLPSEGEGVLFNIEYPFLNAQIHISYLPIKKDQLTQHTEVSRTFVYSHAIKADAINERAYQNPEQNVYGMIYNIEGNVATPTQFFLTDSVHSFFRGALYFNHVPNQDSITPVLEYINQDIEILIESFQWKR